MGGVRTPSQVRARRMVAFAHCTISVHSKSFRIRTYAPSRKCSLYRTCRKAKSFRIRTYKKHGGGGALPATRPSRIANLWVPEPVGAIPQDFGLRRRALWAFRVCQIGRDSSNKMQEYCRGMFVGRDRFTK